MSSTPEEPTSFSDITMKEALSLGLVRLVKREGRPYIMFPPETHDARVGNPTLEMLLRLEQLCDFETSNSAE